MVRFTEKQAGVSIWQIAKAVMFAFIGIRNKNDLEHDAATLKPAQVIIGGVIGALVFVLVLIVLVRIIVN